MFYLIELHSSYDGYFLTCVEDDKNKPGYAFHFLLTIYATGTLKQSQ